MRIGPGNRRPSLINKNKRAEKNFQASFTLNEIWELEKFPFQQLHSRKTQIRSVLNLEKVSVFGLSLWLLNQGSETTKPPLYDNVRFWSNAGSSWTRRRGRLHFGGPAVVQSAKI